MNPSTIRLWSLLALLALVFSGCKSDSPEPDQTPQIFSFSPTAAGAGETITITGANFTTPPETHVSLNGQLVPITAVTATELQVTVPDDPNCSGDLQVAGGGKVATASVAFTFLTTPQIASVTPTSARAGETLVIAGTNFSRTLQENSVTLNGKAVRVNAVAPSGTDAIGSGNMELRITVPDDPDCSGPLQVTVGSMTGTAGEPFAFIADAPEDMVYAAGSEMINRTWTAVLWKNGSRTILGDQSPSWAYSVAVSGSDVYAAGYQGTDGVVWKNGTKLYTLSAGGSATAYSVAVSGADIYAAGNRKTVGTDVATVWKNGQVLYTLNDGINRSQAYSVAVLGTDVYTGGHQANGTTDVATVWKNDQVLYTLGDGLHESKVNAVAVSGSDVYAAGYRHNGTTTVAMLWKNGQPYYTLGSWDLPAGAESVVISGDNVYVSGFHMTRLGEVWENGQPRYSATASAIAPYSRYVMSLSGGNVYTGGAWPTGEHTLATVWKNGQVLYTLGNPHGQTFGPYLSEVSSLVAVPR